MAANRVWLAKIGSYPFEVNDRHPRALDGWFWNSLAQDEPVVSASDALPPWKER